MEDRRRQKWDKYRRSQTKKPPRCTCSWQPTVPSWEKEFCKVVGSLDWETLLQMKKFTHLYENVINWDDSAGKDAFANAKKRFWAKINGRPCDVSLPDPDFYIDKIDWDLEPDPELLSDLDMEPIIPNASEDHDPVVIFGDSLLPTHGYSKTGWGDDEENFKVPANSSSANHCDPWEQNGWQGYSNNAWHPDIEHKIADGESGRWNESNFSRTSRIQGNKDRNRDHISRNMEGRYKATYWRQQSGVDKRSNSREWNSFAITVGQTWNQ